MPRECLWTAEPSREPKNTSTNVWFGVKSMKSLRIMRNESVIIKFEQIHNLTNYIDLANYQCQLHQN